MYPPFLCRSLRALVCALALTIGVAITPLSARAATPVGRVGLPLASSSDNSFSVRKFLAGFNRRDRVVQLCVGVMCLALFILCKKFSEDRC